MRMKASRLRAIISESLFEARDTQGDTLQAESWLIAAAEALRDGTPREDVLQDLSFSAGIGFREAERVLVQLERESREPSATFYSAVRAVVPMLLRRAA